jgi:hypothetical protein
MSDDDINQLTPDDGDVDEVIVARLRSALLDDVEGQIAQKIRRYRLS